MKQTIISKSLKLLMITALNFFSVANANLQNTDLQNNDELTFFRTKVDCSNPEMFKRPEVQKVIYIEVLKAINKILASKHIRLSGEMQPHFIFDTFGAIDGLKISFQSDSGTPFIAVVNSKKNGLRGLRLQNLSDNQGNYLNQCGFPKGRRDPSLAHHVHIYNNNTGIEIDGNLYDDLIYFNGIVVTF